MSGRGSNKPTGPKRGGSGSGRGEPVRTNPQPATSGQTKPGPPPKVGRGAPTQTGSFHNMAQAGGIGRGTPIQQHFKTDGQQKIERDKILTDITTKRSKRDEDSKKLATIQDELKKIQQTLTVLKTDIETLELKKSQAENPGNYTKTLADVKSEFQKQTTSANTLTTQVQTLKKSIDECTTSIVTQEKKYAAEKEKQNKERGVFYDSFTAPQKTLKEGQLKSDGEAPTESQPSQEKPKLKEEEECDKVINILNWHTSQLDKKNKQKGQKQPKKQGEQKDQKAEDAAPSVEEPKKEEDGQVTEKKDEPATETENVEVKDPGSQPLFFKYAELCFFESVSCVVPKTKAEAEALLPSVQKKKLYYRYLRDPSLEAKDEEEKKARELKAEEERKAREEAKEAKLAEQKAKQEAKEAAAKAKAEAAAAKVEAEKTIKSEDEKPQSSEPPKEASDEPKKDQPKVDEPKKEDQPKEEVKQEKPKEEEPKKEEVKEEPKEEPKKEEVKEEVKEEKPKEEKPKEEEPKEEKPKEESKETPKEEKPEEEPKKEEVKEEVKEDKPKEESKEEVKEDKPKEESKEEPKPEQPKPEAD